MERLILIRLKFELFAPSSLFFMEHYAANRVFMAGISQYSGDQARFDHSKPLALYIHLLSISVPSVKNLRKGMKQ